jgi:vacuolar protein sorting-associated protein 13A/C
LDYFERQGLLTSYDQLIDDMTNHYQMQALQQAYVVVLGLDVLGNPYGLIRDLTQGFGDFYKPFMVTINVQIRS